MSDLHLENGFTGNWGNQYDDWPSGGWPVTAPYLILAGDIGLIVKHFDNLGTWFENRCSEYKKVFYVLGNKEFPNRENLDHEAVILKIKSLEKETRMRGRLVFLNRNRYDLRDNGTIISILGCSLWTKIREDHKADVQYRRGNPLEQVPGNSVAKHNRRFEMDFQWLTDEVKKIRAEKMGRERKILIITHHTPFLRGGSRNTNNPKKGMSDLYSMYNNDILGGCGIEGLGVGDMWVYGHTHYTNDLFIDNLRVYSNQRGSRYPPKHIENPARHDFDLERTFEF
jgi:hypothetical protein